MGYRSDGKLYLSEELYNRLPEELKKDLEDDWERDSDNIWSFYNWKWYSGYSNVKAWEDFFEELQEDDSVPEEDFDFIAVGEDGECHEELTGTHFGTATTIEVYG